MAAKRPLVVAVDLGGTQIRVALSDLEGNFVRRDNCPTEASQGQEAVLRRLAARIQEVRQGFSDTDILGVGIGSPGPVDALAGLIISPPNLPGWEEVPLRDLLEQRTSLPVRLANDANAAALGEWAFGKGRGRQNVVYVTISTGIGGGVILGGRVLEGAHGMAGEFGHMIVRAGGPACNLGHPGCLEGLASGTAVARRAAESVAAGIATTIPEHVAPGSVLDARAVAAAAAAGDGVARAILQDAGEALGLGIASLINAFDPSRVVVGGGLSRAWSLLRPSLESALTTVVMSPDHRQIDVVTAALGDDAGLVGAAVHAFAEIR